MITHAEKDLEQIRSLEKERQPQIMATDHALGFHLMPPVGWLNDPNGLCECNGVYHIFFQYSPKNADGGEKYWGHYTTKDFINYTYTGPFMSPDNPLDKDGVYSGSAYVEDGEIYVYYTGNVKEKGDYDYTYAGRLS
ncbi:MAG: glycosyl hydrolase family 32, partial [Lachnospiraceae bacterium]|nr:glycosyl hydrolase family 32 [Lachnospiraceae bacterium]